MIFCVYWIIDLGPDGGDKGGEIVVLGTTETVAEHLTSHMGRYLKQVLAQHPPEVVAVVGGVRRNLQYGWLRNSRMQHIGNLTYQAKPAAVLFDLLSFGKP